MHLALYCFASSQLSTALSLLYRARYLMLLVFGEDHPEMALLDVSVGEGRSEQTGVPRWTLAFVHGRGGELTWLLPYPPEQHWAGAAWCNGV